MKRIYTNGRQGKSLWAFFIVTFAFSWLMWIPLAVSGRAVSLSGGGISLVFLMIGAFSPSITGVIMTYRYGDKEDKENFWRRVFDFRRIGFEWYALILLLFPGIMTLTFFLESLLGGSLPSLDGASQTLLNPSSLFIFIMSMLIGGPLAEELGWRGFALERLQATLSAFRASLVLGIIHAAWHLPMFFIQGTSQESMGIGTLLFWLWVVQVVTGSIFFTWVFNNNQGSILSAILIHFMSNATFTLIAQLGNALPVRIEVIRTTITLAFAVMALRTWEIRKMIFRTGEKTT